MKSQREEELKQRRSIYEWGDDDTYLDLPGYVKAADVKTLPKDVQFTEEAMYDLHKARRAALINLGLVKLLNLFDNWDDFDDYRKVLLFFFSRTEQERTITLKRKNDPYQISLLSDLYFLVFQTSKVCLRNRPFSKKNNW